VRRLAYPELARPGHLEVLGAAGRHPSGGILRFGGGTALALVYLGHRISVDLDFFVATPEELDDGVRVVLEVLRTLEFTFQPDLSAHHHKSFEVPIGKFRLRIDLFTEPLVGSVRCETLDPERVQVLPLETLFLLKARAAACREGLDRLKDLVDLLAIAGRGLAMPRESLARESGTLDGLIDALGELEELVPGLPLLRIRSPLTREYLLEQRDLLLRSLVST